jgi:hypothetical protein
MKRKIKIVKENQKPIELEISKATSVKTNKQMIHLDQLEDESWRLIYNENLIKDFSEIVGFIVIRENNDEPYKRDFDLDIKWAYNPEYGDERICECGHPYYRHFDSYDDMYACGCKYCGCDEFIEKN